MHRLSIVGYACVHCEAIMGEELKCPGCGWIDPMTREPKGSRKKGARYDGRGQRKEDK